MFCQTRWESKLAPVIQPFGVGTISLAHQWWLSFIEDHGGDDFPRLWWSLCHGLSTYVAALADLLDFQDNQQDAPLFAFLGEDSGVDGSRDRLSGFNQYFEIQILTRFGISLNFNECVFAIRSVRPLTFLSNGPASAQSIIMRMRALSSKSQYPYLLNQFQAIDFETEPFRLRPNQKEAKLRKFMDQL